MDMYDVTVKWVDKNRGRQTNTLRFQAESAKMAKHKARLHAGFNFEGYNDNKASVSVQKLGQDVLMKAVGAPPLPGLEVK